MTMIRWKPFFMESLEDTDRFFDESSGLVPVKGFSPALDVYEKDQSIVVETPLAGVSPDDVKIIIENDVLMIEGATKKRSEIDEKNYYRKEVRYGSFYRSIPLPVSVESDKAEASYENGVLKIRIPKAQKALAKTIKIDVKK